MIDSLLSALLYLQVINPNSSYLCDEIANFRDQHQIEITNIENDPIQMEAILYEWEDKASVIIVWPSGGCHL